MMRTPTTLAAPLNAEKHAKAEQLDGCYLIKTDRSDLSGDELRRIYVLLTGAESAFRDMKSPLAEWPIFHHTERRTEAHIFLCVLAYLERLAHHAGHQTRHQPSL
jgi:hypothetical protein